MPQVGEAWHYFRIGDNSHLNIKRNDDPGVIQILRQLKPAYLPTLILIAERSSACNDPSDGAVLAFNACPPSGFWNTGIS